MLNFCHLFKKILMSLKITKKNATKLLSIFSIINSNQNHTHDVYFCNNFIIKIINNKTYDYISIIYNLSF